MPKSMRPRINVAVKRKMIRYHENEKPSKAQNKEAFRVVCDITSG